MFSIRAITAAACGLLSLAAGDLRAQGSTPAQSVVITAARWQQPLAEVLGDLRVIDREQIERAGVAGLAPLLQRLAGVEISTTGGPGQISGVFLRGSNANHLVLLVDGVRVNSATSGTTALEQLPLDQIERIEVLLGPASGLYGADAIGGVIQVFTRQGQGASASVTLGSESTRAVAAGYGTRTGSTRWSLQGGWRSSHAASATNADNPYSFNPDADPYRNANVGGQVEHGWASGHALTLRANLSDSSTHFDSAPGSDDFNEQRLTVLALESRDRVAAGWTSLVRLARGSDAIVTHGAYPSRFRTDQDQFSWQHDLDLAGGHVAAGVEWRREQVDSDTAYSTTERRVAALFGGWTGSFGAHRLQLALRHDDDSQFGGNSSGNLAWGWTFAPGWTVSAAAGSAFKAPSFNDLYYPLQYGYSGNPDLKPERSRSVETGLRYAQGNLAYGVTVFDNRISDLIAVNDSFTTVENVSRARIRGLDLSGRWSSGPWALRAEATLQAPENSDTGTLLTRRSRQHCSAGLDWAAGAWRLGTEVVASGKRLDSGGATLGGYSLVNLTAAWTASPGWTVGARVDNLSDRDYTLVSGYNTPRRNAYLTLSWDGT